ncbi:uncharacterized protein LOC121810730 [Salvia splendens]|uniref:uncharacterized protein LOC121810730 n=1 Tax=Salvia splendens TaxID=180675 RepID=UPI001C26212B|nr:uncharacterized protein LOC121810730 [Salvia splendens]
MLHKISASTGRITSNNAPKPITNPPNFGFLNSDTAFLEAQKQILSFSLSVLSLLSPSSSFSLPLRKKIELSTFEIFRRSSPIWRRLPPSPASAHRNRVAAVTPSPGGAAAAASPCLRRREVAAAAVAAIGVVAGSPFGLLSPVVGFSADSSAAPVGQLRFTRTPQGRSLPFSAPNSSNELDNRENGEMQLQTHFLANACPAAWLSGP